MLLAGLTVLAAIARKRWRGWQYRSPPPDCWQPLAALRKPKAAAPAQAPPCA
jgi:hypothetical protein